MGSRPNPSGGRSVGVAMGIVRINTGQLTSDADRAKSAFKAISDSGRQIGTGVKAGTDQARAELNNLTQAANQAVKQLAQAFALPALIATTQNVRQLNFAVRQVAGSEKQAVEYLQQMDKLADRMGKSMLEVQRATVPLLPMIKRYGLDLAQTVMLAERLALVDPTQGTQGAALAIREFLSGQTTSLAMRFELGKDDLNKILQSAGGDQQKMMEGLDQLIAQAGYTEQSLIDARDAGLNAFGRLKGEIQSTLATGFEPFLVNGLLPTVEGFNDFFEQLRKTNPELLEIAGTLAGILATMTALNAVGLGGKWTNRIGVTAGALYAGSEIGTGMARYLAETGVIKNDRLKGVSQDEAKAVLTEYFKQALVGLFDLIVQFSGAVEAGITITQNFVDGFTATLETLRIAIEIGAELVKLGFENIQTIIGNAANNIATVIGNISEKLSGGFELMLLDFQDAFASVLKGLGQFLIDGPFGGKADSEGFALVNAATANQGGRDLDRLDAQQRAGQDLNEGTVGILDGVKSTTVELEVLLLEFADAMDKVKNSTIGLTDEQAAEIIARTEQLRQRFVIPLAAMLGLLEEKTGSWLDRVRNGLGNQGRAAPVEVSDFTADMLEAFKKFQNDLKDLEAKAAADRQKAVEDAAKRRNDAEKKLEADLAKTDQDANKRRREIITKSQQSAEQEEKDHRQRLADIVRNTFRDAVRAAARLDAVALRAALERGADGVRSENESYKRQKDQREASLQQELVDIDTARQERINALQAGYAEELVAINAQRTERINQINAQLRDEINQKNLAFAELHNKLAAESGNHNIRMLNIQQAGTAMLEKQYREWLGRMGQQMGYAGSSSSPQTQAAATTVSNAGKQFRARIPGFKTGTGRVPYTGMFNLHENEIVLNTMTSALVRSMTGSQEPTQPQMQSAFSRGADRDKFSLGNLTVVLPDNVGDKLSRAEIEALARQGAKQGIVEWWKEAARE
jgi:hypothetical protein